MKIDIKPMTVNRAWKGKRFKTKEYKQYEKDVLLLLPKKYDIPEGDLQVKFKFGLSSKLADYDNCIKLFQDLLQKKYKFDDRRIFRALIEKEIVKKGKEYIEFDIKPYIKSYI